MECSECTLCCTLCVVEELNKPAGTACDYCDSGCSIYDKRPQSCRDLRCAYHQATAANIAVRPDNLGVVFEKLDTDLIFGTVNPKHESFKHLDGQINAFLNEGINVVLSKSGVPIVYHLDDVAPESLLKRIHEIAA